MDEKKTPAFSDPFQDGRCEPVHSAFPRGRITRRWALGGATGAGVRVAIVDSGVDATHPAIGPVQGYADIIEDADGIRVSTEPHEDLFGHGTACAGIVRKLAPDCEIYSVRVLGGGLFGTGKTLLRGIEWAVENGCQVCNLSLGTTQPEFFAALHKLIDSAYFKSIVMVVAANNAPIPSFPAVFAGVVSVASHEVDDPEWLLYNVNPPVEFGAHGINVRVPWRDHSYVVSTGNSYATPHVTSIVARILSKHPNLSPPELKTVLKAISRNSVSAASRSHNKEPK